MKDCIKIIFYGEKFGILIKRYKFFLRRNGWVGDGKCDQLLDLLSNFDQLRLIFESEEVKDNE